MRTHARTLGASSLLALIAISPPPASAQSQLDTSQATAFIGTWAIDFDSPQGSFVLDLELTDSSGKVAASIGSDQMGGMQDVTDITLSGANLVLSYEFDAQGQLIPVALTLGPDGAATMDFADGAFTMGGQGTKNP
jgi:hypothetical protein